MENDFQTKIYNSAADFLSVLANRKRLLILGLISDGEMKVGKLAELTGLSQSALSQHLALLRSNRLVKTRRDAQIIYYSLSSDAVRTMFETINLLFAPSATELTDNIGTRRGEQPHHPQDRIVLASLSQV